ncbi:MAG: thermonuclease family protein, partial [Candidatus Omnitrophota bacterium]
MRKETKLLYTLALAVAYLLYMGFKSLPVQKPAFEKEGGFYAVERVTDGDTIKLSDGRKVRLIGVDTPEVHYSNKLVRDAKRSRKDVKTIQALGKRASKFTKGLLEGSRVRLEYDVTKKDKYGRFLAYVYKEDGTFVNAKIL